MGRVWVQGATIEGGRVVRMGVQLGSLPRRVIDRDTATRWLGDGHSFLTPQGRALQLVGVDGDDGVTAWFIREDHQPVAADQLPVLPPA